MSSPKRLILIDGSGFIFRAYHSLPPLTRRDGTPVGAVYGFINMILKLREAMPSSHMAVIFDAGRVTFRNELYSDYKAHRPPPPEDLIPQFALVREATLAMTLPSVELANCEADDVIATYARMAQKAGLEVIIVSSDKDLMQLIGDGVSMYDGMKNKAIGPEQVMEKFGVTPDKVIEVMALIGDSTDNVPGVPSIGPKTAAELIGMYGTLENLLEHAGEIKQPKRREVLMANSDKARLSKQLVTLKCDCALPLGLEALEMKELDAAKLLSFLQEQHFSSLVERLSKKFGIVPSPVENAGVQRSAEAPLSPRERDEGYVPVLPQEEETAELITTLDALDRWQKEALQRGRIALELIASLNEPALGLAMALSSGKRAYMPFNHVADKAAPPKDLFAAMQNADGKARQENQLEMASALALLAPMLAHPGVLKIAHDVKWLERYLGAEIRGFDDTMMLSYLLGAGMHGHAFEETVEREFEIAMPGIGKEAAVAGVEAFLTVAAMRAGYLFRLYEILKPRLIREKLTALYEHIERPLIPVIGEMEKAGVKIDREYLIRLGGEFERDMAALEAEIHRIAGRSFNIGSPKQLGEILFDEMKLPGGKKSGKSGTYGTDVGVLEELQAEGHAIAGKVLEWRQLSKLKGTYTDALVKSADKDCRIHTHFALAVASTGRLSSSDPNLQNIPIRTGQGKKIRHAFIAASGYHLMSADYSQIELRLLADAADIEPLKRAFREGKDIHSATASQMFGIPLEEVKADLRRNAKMINFGIIYGISAHGLATRLGIPRKEAADYIEVYFKQYPGIKAYMERSKEQARALGYVTTFDGRRCYLKYIREKNPNLRAFAERAAINAPLQGGAADIIKRAMVAVDRLLREKHSKSRMLLQVHDELLFEIAEGEQDWLPPLIKKTMESAAHFSVPLVVETGLGTHWGEIH